MLCVKRSSIYVLFDGCDLYIENIIIHVLIMLRVVLIFHVTCYSMKWHNCISYARGHRVKLGVYAWYWLFTILVNV